MTSQSGQPENPKSWNARLQPGWTDVIALWGWQPLNDGKDGYYIGGKCPYCDHDIDRVLEPVVTIFETMLPPPEKVWIQCNCKVAHPPHNAGEGCGQAAEIPGPNVHSH